MPSHLSPKPSPASSVSSQPGWNASNCGGNSIGSSVTVPYNIPSLTSFSVSIPASVLSACALWEQADALSRENKGEFVPSGFLSYVLSFCVHTCLNPNIQCSKHHA